MVDGVLIQCVSLVCRSPSAFLSSVCMSVWSMACMSLVVCWLFLKWYDSREVFHFTSSFICFSRVCILFVASFSDD